MLRELPGKTIVLGVLDLGSSEAETPEVVAERIRRALEVVPPERLVVAPDCGMKYLPRELAFAKLEAMVAGARLVAERCVTRPGRTSRSPASAGPTPTGSRCAAATSPAT